MKIMVSLKEKGEIKSDAQPVKDKHLARKMKRLARNRFYQRQVNMPDPE